MNPKKKEKKDIPTSTPNLSNITSNALFRVMTALRRSFTALSSSNNQFKVK